MFEALAQPERHLILFGEWCGQGIQKGVAISQIGRKVFAVFAAQTGDHQLTAATLITEPGDLAELVPQHPDIFVLPWHGDPIEVDFADPATAADALNKAVEQVEHKDPWVKAVFEVEGTGEGVVLYPQIDGERDDITSLMFKAKGDKHRVRKSAKAVEVDPAIARSIQEFVDTFVTEARLHQGLTEVCPDGATMRQIGGFLKWMNSDVRKESSGDLEAAGLEWRQVAKAVTGVCKAWFRAQL